MQSDSLGIDISKIIFSIHIQQINFHILFLYSHKCRELLSINHRIMYNFHISLKEFSSVSHSTSFYPHFLVFFFFFSWFVVCVFISFKRNSRMTKSNAKRNDSEEFLFSISNISLSATFYLFFFSHLFSFVINFIA